MTHPREAIAVRDLAHARGYSFDELRYRAAHGDEQAARILREIVANAAKGATR